MTPSGPAKRPAERLVWRKGRWCGDFRDFADVGGRLMPLEVWEWEPPVRTRADAVRACNRYLRTLQNARRRIAMNHEIEGDDVISDLDRQIRAYHDQGVDLAAQLLTDIAEAERARATWRARWLREELREHFPRMVLIFAAFRIERQTGHRR
jgi:hypothetical protein